MIPRVLGKTNFHGVPVFAVLFSMAGSLLALLSSVVAASTVYLALVAVSGLATLVVWASVSVCHLRFRKQWLDQGHSADDLKYRAPGFPFVPIAAIVMCIGALVLVICDSSQRSTLLYMIPFVAICYIGYYASVACAGSMANCRMIRGAIRKADSVCIIGRLGGMSPEALSELIFNIANNLVNEGKAGTLTTDLIPPQAKFAVMRPKDRAHGDWASNAAMQLAKKAGMKPHDFAELFAAELANADGIKSVEVAGPGFINIVLDSASAAAVVDTVLNEGANYGKNDHLSGKTLNLEFVSANPTGPIHIGGHPLGRGRRLHGPRA